MIDRVAANHPEGDPPLRGPRLPSMRLRTCAAWAGAVNLVLVFALSIYNQLAVSVPFDGPFARPGLLPPRHSGTGGPGHDCLLSRRGLAIAGRVSNRLQVALSVAVFGFIAAQALSAIVVSGFVPLHYLAQAVGCAGLVLGVAAIPSGQARRLLIAIGSLYGALNLVGVLAFFLSRGAAFPSDHCASSGTGTIHFTQGTPLPDPRPLIGREGKPFPTSLLQAFRAINGLSTNENLTGNYLLVLVVYQVHNLMSGLRSRSARPDLLTMALAAPSVDGLLPYQLPRRDGRIACGSRHRVRAREALQRAEPALLRSRFSAWE